MLRRAALFACGSVLLYVGLASAQDADPIMEQVAPGRQGKRCLSHRGLAAAAVRKPTVRTPGTRCEP
jgi:hypothetical protein